MRQHLDIDTGQYGRIAFRVDARFHGEAFADATIERVVLEPGNQEEDIEFAVRHGQYVVRVVAVGVGRILIDTIKLHLVQVLVNRQG